MRKQRLSNEGQVFTKNPTLIYSSFLLRTYFFHKSGLR